MGGTITRKRYCAILDAGTTRRCTSLLVMILFIAWVSPPLSSCAPASPDPLDGIEALQVGTYIDIPAGRLYLPQTWLASDEKAWPVTVILHGYGELSRSLSGRPAWIELAEKYGIVLFFVETGHMGWIERRDSADTRLITAVLRSFRRKPWVKPGGLQLMGWSAGAIMTQGMVGINRVQPDGSPLFDRLAAVSGGFGSVLDDELKKNPRLDGVIRVPVFISWGEQEAPDHGCKAAVSLQDLGFRVQTATQPGDHVLTDPQIRQALSGNRR
jgi:predicted esterase